MRRRKKREKKGEFFEIKQKGKPVKRKGKNPTSMFGFGLDQMV